MSQTNTEKVVLYIDSQQRSGGVPENFTINLGSGIRKVQYVEVIGAEIPYTFYAINSSNNTVAWSNATNVAFIAQISIGNYGVTSFLTVLQNAMNAVMSGFTITYIKATYKISFANATPFRLDLVNGAGASTVAPLLGLSAPVPATGTAVVANPSGVINLGGPRYLLIKSSRLTKPKITRPFLNTTQDNVLYKVVITGAPGDILIEKNSYTNLLKYGVRQNIQSMDFQLVDDQNNTVDLNGQNWSLTVNLVTG